MEVVEAEESKDAVLVVFDPGELATAAAAAAEEAAAEAAAEAEEVVAEAVARIFLISLVSSSGGESARLQMR